ncbi:MAG: hypothetical protein ACKVRN_10900 [Pyrinomonadaceae bacterium]
METPKEILKRLTNYDTEPKLTEDDLDGILARVALEDGEGLAPDDSGWEPTYDINAAAAEGWLVKAAKAFALTEAEPTLGLVVSKVFDNCRAMARIYTAKRWASVSIR